jgi:hypothetical protein
MSVHLEHRLSDGSIEVRYNIDLTRQTRLSEMRIYPPNVSIGYPRTSQDRKIPIGHLVPNNPEQWRNITSEIQYSLGPPRGQKSNVFVGPLVDQSGKPVPCTRKFATCKY